MEIDILKLYHGVLDSVNIQVDDNGLASFKADGQLVPVMVGDKRLALPTSHLLRTGAWEGLQPFHPLSEHILRGESPVLKKIKAAATMRLVDTLSQLLLQLVALGADTDRHKKIPPKASEILSYLKEADEKSVGAMERILSNVTLDGPHRLVSIYLKRGGKLKGVKYQRLAVVSFPIMAEFDNDDPHVFGIKLRKKDYLAFGNLLNYLLPEGEDLETYSYGSQSDYAPYFDALIHSYAIVGERLNQVVNLYRKQLENVDDLRINLDWIDLAFDLKIYRDLIPTLPGNEGDVEGKEEPAVRPAPAIHVQAPIKVNVPIRVEETKDSPYNSNFTRRDIDGPAETPSLFNPTPGYGNGPVVGHSQGMADHVGVVHSSTGVDFRSVMAARERSQAAAFGGHMAAPAGTFGATPTPAGEYAGFHRGMAIPQSTWGMVQPVNQWGQNNAWANGQGFVSQPSDFNTGWNQGQRRW